MFVGCLDVVLIKPNKRLIKEGFIPRDIGI